MSKRSFTVVAVVSATAALSLSACSTGGNNTGFYIPPGTPPSIIAECDNYAEQVTKPAAREAVQDGALLALGAGILLGVATNQWEYAAAAGAATGGGLALGGLATDRANERNLFQWCIANGGPARFGGGRTQSSPPPAPGG